MREVPPLFEALAAGDQERVISLKDKIFELENDADTIKNELRNNLPKSLFMPVDRRDLLEVLQMQDSIADTAQDVAGLLVERPMGLPEFLKEPLMTLAERCVDACEHSGKIIEELDELDHDEASLQQACVGGVSLMELLVGYRRAIIVDAIIDPEEAPGSVWCRPLSAVETGVASHLDSSHDAPLPAAIEAGRAMGADLPSDIDVVGIVIQRGDIFGEELSDVVAAAVPVAAAEVVGVLRERRPSSPQGEPVHA